MFHVKQGPENVKNQPNNRVKPVSSGLWLALPALLIFLVLAAGAALFLSSDASAGAIPAHSAAAQRVSS